MTQTISNELLRTTLERVLKSIKCDGDLEPGTHPVDITARIKGDVVKGEPSSRITVKRHVSEAQVLAAILAAMDATQRKRAVGAAVKKVASGVDLTAQIKSAKGLLDDYAGKHGLIEEIETEVAGRTTGAPLMDVTEVRAAGQEVLC